MNLSKLTDDGLEALIADVLEERNRRRDGGLEFRSSLRLLRQAARERRFVSYKDVADASGASWTAVRYLVNRHLWRLLEWGVPLGVPMLSSIVVDKGNVETGRKQSSGLKGFTEAAKSLGYRVDDPEAFHRYQQEACFAWAARTADPTGER